MNGSACVQVATEEMIVATKSGEVMVARAVIVVAASTLLASCADSDRLRSGLGGPAVASEVQQDPARQTLASKVLGALALERVTDRKPDPARLNELH